MTDSDSSFDPFENSTDDTVSMDGGSSEFSDSEDSLDSEKQKELWMERRVQEEPMRRGFLEEEEQDEKEELKWSFPIDVLNLPSTIIIDIQKRLDFNHHGDSSKMLEILREIHPMILNYPQVYKDSHCYAFKNVQYKFLGLAYKFGLEERFEHEEYIQNRHIHEFNDYE